jgi:hypothetical protein
VGEMTGLNIQTPWSFLLINELKCVETRSYPLPKKYEGVELALIETPGKVGRFKSRIIGTITFSHSFKYPDKQSWIDDYNRHKVEEFDDNFKWDDNKPKYGWVVCSVKKFDTPIDITKRKGIIFTKGCRIK